MSAVVKAVKKVVKTVAKAVTKVVDTVVNTAKAIIKDPLPTIAALAGQAIGIPAPVTMAAITGAKGGDLGDMAKAAAIAYVAPQAASKVASTIAPTVGTAITNKAVAGAVTAATSKALVNGSIAAATGGDFGEAAAGTMAGSLAASGYQNLVAPSVVAQAQGMGLSLDASKDLSAALRTGVAAGTATGVAGGDFVSGFATAIADYGIEEGFTKVGDTIKTSSAGEALRASPVGTAVKKISETMDNVSDAIDNAFKKKDVTNTASLGNGVPNDVVNEVPVSPNAQPGVVANADGKTIGTINPASNDDAFNQLVAAFEEGTGKPRTLGGGTKVAALESVDGKPLAEVVPGSGPVTDEPVFPGSGYNVGQNQRASATRQQNINGKNVLVRDITDANGETTTYYFDPTDKKITAEPKGLMSADDLRKGITVTASPVGPATAAETKSDILETILEKSPTSAVPTAKPSTYEPPAKAPELATDLDDLRSLQKAISVPAATPSLPELKQKVEEAKAEVSNAAVDASVAPTPDNTQKLDDAQANLELAQKTYENAAAQPPDVTAQPSPLLPVAPIAPSLPELEAAAQEAKAAAVDATVVAQALPTPDNLQAARDAQLSAELAQAALNEAAQKTELAPTLPTEAAPPTTVSTTFPGEVPTETTGQPTTFTPPTALPSTEGVEGGLLPSTIGGMLRGDAAGVTGGLGTLSTEPGAGVAEGVPGGIPGGIPGGVADGTAEGVAGGLPGGLPGGVPGGMGEAGLEGGIGEDISRLPEVEVTGELDEDGKYIGPRFPLTDASGSRFPVIVYNYLGEPVGRRMVRRSPLTSLLGATGTDKDLLGDLGSGVSFIDQPLEFLQPSMLARGGLIRFRRK